MNTNEVQGVAWRTPTTEEAGQGIWALLSFVDRDAVQAAAQGFPDGEIGPDVASMIAETGVEFGFNGFGLLSLQDALQNLEAHIDLDQYRIDSAENATDINTKVYRCELCGFETAFLQFAEEHDCN